MVDKKYDDFRDLKAWEKCRNIRVTIWEMCKEFPKEEKYRLSDQLIRASRSATACIAEGYGRFHYQENIQFCRQARGSLYELIDHLTITHETKFLTGKDVKKLIEDIKESIRILNGYIRYLKNQKKTND